MRIRDATSNADHVNQRNTEYFSEWLCSLCIFIWHNSAILNWVSNIGAYEIC